MADAERAGGGAECPAGGGGLCPPVIPGEAVCALAGGGGGVAGLAVASAPA